MTERVSILGATGSVGRSTLDVLRRNPDRFGVASVVAGSNAAGLAAIARETRASFAALADPTRGAELKEALAGTGIASGAGAGAVLEAARRDADIVVAAICGTAGLAPTHAALKSGRRIALANKESLVCAGAAFMRDAAQIGATILPLDSEHNALAQALTAGNAADVTGLTVTASGGPFRAWSRERMAAATPADTAKHPTYSMGDKINVDSASLMNKGLELIEAHHLFGMRPDQLDAVVHPQQIIHGLVHWRDGSVTATLAFPDMRVPVAHCLGGAARLDVDLPRLDLAKLSTFTFEAPDEQRFPCFALARRALEEGGAMPAVLNGANEIAVAAFLDRRIGFLDIAVLVEETCSRFGRNRAGAAESVEEALMIDDAVRRMAEEIVQTLGLSSRPPVRKPSGALKVMPR